MIAIGDSLVNGVTPDLAGIKGQSWARWVAETADIPYEQYAQGGLTSTQIVETFLPRVTGSYEYGVFSMGTNDALKSWDAAMFRQNVEIAAERLVVACNRVVVLSVPFCKQADDIVREVANDFGAVVVDGEVRGRQLSRPDGVHPTALGYLHIADRAATALGLPAPSLATPKPAPLGLSYTMRHVCMSGYFRAKGVARKLAR
jgi:hypothetical protein